MKTDSVIRRSEKLLREANAPYLVADKREALAEFLARLEAEHADDIERVILFGSQARGDADGESDIDLLIVTRPGMETLQRIRRWCREHHVGWVSEIVYSAEMYEEDQRFKTPLYVNLRRDGIELWNPAEQEIEERQVPLDFIEGEFRVLDYETIITVRSYLSNMRESLSLAHEIEKLGYTRKAVSELYYAAFYVTTAALYIVNVVRGKHSGIESAVSQFLVKTGLLEEEYHKIFVNLQEGRLSADYPTQTKLKGKRILTEDELKQLLRDGERYIERMKRFLIERGVDKSDFA